MLKFQDDQKRLRLFYNRYPKMVKDNSTSVFLSKNRGDPVRYIDEGYCRLMYFVFYKIAVVRRQLKY